jgi:osmoprotectant transport system substrate-binding protein
MFKSFKTTAVSILTAAALMAGAAQATEIKIGGKNFTEQLLMTEITAQLLAAKGYDAVRLGGMGTSVVRSALENGQVDVYWEYTGTSLITFHKIEERMNPEKTYETVRDLDAKVGITWLAPSKANSTYAIAVRTSDDKGLTTFSDFAAAYNAETPLKFGVNSEFPKREDGLLGLQETYNFKVGRENLVPMETGLIYTALKEEKLDVGLVFALDGRIAAFDFKVLEDDLGFFPNYALTPNIRTEVLEANPEVGELLTSLSAIFTDENVRALCARVDVDKVTVEDTATEFLTAQGLI